MRVSPDSAFVTPEQLHYVCSGGNRSSAPSPPSARNSRNTTGRGPGSCQNDKGSRQRACSCPGLRFDVHTKTPYVSAQLADEPTHVKVTILLVRRYRMKVG